MDGTSVECVRRLTKETIHNIFARRKSTHSLLRKMTVDRYVRRILQYLEVTDKYPGAYSVFFG